MSSFDEAFALSDAAVMDEMARSADAGNAVQVGGQLVRAVVDEPGADNRPEEGGPVAGAEVRVTISVEDFVQKQVRVGTAVLVPGAPRESLVVLGIRGQGATRALFCGASGAGRVSEF